MTMGESEHVSAMNLPLLYSLAGFDFSSYPPIEYESEYYFDMDSNPTTREQWIDYFEDDNLRQIAKTRIAGCVVSTVYLGLNHAFMQGEVLIFETMIFNRIKRKKARPWNPSEWCMRYRYKDQARLGHERVVNRLWARGWASLDGWGWYEDGSAR